jgi:HK97 family phage portal protein
MNWKFWKREALTSDSNEGWHGWINNGYTSAGQPITNSTALQISTVYDCVRVISEDLAKLPLQVFQATSENDKERRRDHPLQRVISWWPNPEMTAISFWNSIVSHSVGWGNGYAEKVRDRNGDIIQLWLITPDRVTIKRRENGTLYYEIREEDGSVTELSKENMFHVPGFGYDGVQGYNVVEIARESLGLAAGAEQFGAKFFGNGAKTSLALRFPEKLSEIAYKNLQRSAEQQIAGQNQHKVLLVEEGGEVQTLSLSQKDSQYLETRQFSVIEICRWFRMPPHKVADLTRSTFSNIEEQNIDYVTDTLGSWFTRFEQAVHNQLFTEEDQQDGYYVKYNDNALLRGDTEGRFNAYSKGINDGWLTRNEVRQLEDLNPLEGLDEPLVSQNTRPASAEPELQEAVVEDIAQRIATAEERGLSARVDKANEDRGRFDEWVHGFYERHEMYVAKCIKPLINEAHVVDSIIVSGILNVAISEDPAEHIKTWNRKQEITDIINEALLCTTK